MPGGPYGTDEQRAALRRLAARRDRCTASTGADRYRACRDLLLARPPRVAGVATGGEPLYADATDVDELRELVAGHGRQLPGHPGPARLGQDLHRRAADHEPDREGKRVGVTSTSHKAIHNMLDEVEEAADEDGLEFRGLKKCSAGNAGVGVRVRPHRQHERQRRAHGSRGRPHRRHRLALRPRGGRRDARLPLHRRGRPGLARRRARARHRRAQHRAARRPAAAPAGDPGRPPRRLGVSALEHVLGDARRSRPTRRLPRQDLAPAPRRLRASARS